MAIELSVKPSVSLALAKEIAAAAAEEAQRSAWNVSIAVVDEAGRLLYFERMDEATNASADIAIAKARHSANYRRDTKYHQDLLAGGNAVILALPATVSIEGGLRLIHDGRVIGAIGVSGVQADQDGQIARAGAAVLGG